MVNAAKVNATRFHELAALGCNAPAALWAKAISFNSESSCFLWAETGHTRPSIAGAASWPQVATSSQTARLAVLEASISASHSELTKI